jgi:hypothetical protein
LNSKCTTLNLRNGVLDNFAVSKVPGRGNYEEPHFMQHGAPPHSVRPVRAWLGNYFPRWWTGRGEKENGRHERPIVLHVIFFSGALEQTGILPIEITKTS